VQSTEKSTTTTSSMSFVPGGGFTFPLVAEPLGGFTGKEQISG